MNLHEFLESIESDYLYLLYKKFNNIFPGCCLEASNILCGFIQLFYDATFVQKYITNVPYPHSYISNSKGIIIDFTSFQYIQRNGYEDVTKEALLNIARKCECFPVSANIYLGNTVTENYVNSTFNVIDIPCFYLDDEKLLREKYTSADFIKYCNNYATKIGDMVSDYINYNVIPNL
jgi:hypothetical protein